MSLFRLLFDKIKEFKHNLYMCEIEDRKKYIPQMKQRPVKFQSDFKGSYKPSSTEREVKEFLNKTRSSF